MRNKLFFSLAAIPLLIPNLYSCNRRDAYFTYWNECDSLSTLKEFVSDVTNKESKNYIPVEDRLVTFDMDGTLMSETAPIPSEWIFLADYASKHEEIKNVLFKIEEEKISSGENETHDVSIGAVVSEIDTYMETREKPTKDGEYKIDLGNRRTQASLAGFKDMTIDNYYLAYTDFLYSHYKISYEDANYINTFFLPMIEVMDYLYVNDFTICVCSGSEKDNVVPSILNVFSYVKEENILGVGVNHTINERGEEVRTAILGKPCYAKAKVERIKEKYGDKIPVLSFGNTTGDEYMNDYCLSNKKYKSKAFMVLPDDREREFGKSDKEVEELRKRWSKYSVISMKDDFKTIYKYEVKKK